RVARGRPESLPSAIEVDERSGRQPRAPSQDETDARQGRHAVADDGGLLVPLPAVGDRGSDDRRQCGEGKVRAVEQAELEEAEPEVERKEEGADPVPHLRRDVGEEARQPEIDDVRRARWPPRPTWSLGSPRLDVPQ